MTRALGSRLWALGVVTLCGAILFAQQPRAPSDPTFRADIRYIELPVRALDAQSRFVRGLQRSDFTVFENGHLQQAASFDLVDIPFVKRDLEPARSSVIPPAEIDLNGTPTDGRVYAIILDDYHFEPRFTFKVRNLIRQFAENHMSADDLVGVFTASGSRGQNFTRDGSLVIAAAERFIGESDADVPAQLVGGQNGAVLKMVRNISDRIASIRGRRKSILYISAAGPTSGCNLMPGRNDSLCNQLLRDAVRAAQLAGVTIYSIDASGSQAFNSSNAEFSGPGGMSDGLRGISENGPVEVSARSANAIKAAELSRNNPLSGLRVLADDTGGFAVIDTNSYPAALARIVDENSSYYLIGYYSTNPSADGKIRQSRVAVNDKALRLFYRTTYLAPRSPRP